MVRAPCFDKNGLKKGAWSEEEDNKLRAYVERYGHWNWRELPKYAGLSRCGKSCRLRWVNYLKPNVKRGNYTKEEDDLIIELHKSLGNKWSAIAEKLPGRSDNEIKNHWHTSLKKRCRKTPDVSENKHLEGDHKSNEAEHKEEPMKPSNLSVKDEAEILLAVLSSESAPSSSSSSTGLSSSSSLTGSDSVVSNGAISKPSDYESIGDFWSEPFLSDSDSIRSDENLLSPLDFVDSYIPSWIDHYMIMNDDFLWSTMDLYCPDDTHGMN